MTEFEKRVDVIPAYDKRTQGYGIGSCRIRFVLKGRLGAVQFLIGTNWEVPSAREHLQGFPLSARDLQRKPDGWDVGYHSPKPLYDGQCSMSGECDVLDGPCYYDGSGLLADDWIEDFVAGGTAWLWPRMEAFYRETFTPKTEGKAG